LAAVQVDEVQASQALIRIVARTRPDRVAVCPGCGQASDWEHSRYVRHVADEAIGGRPVVVDLSVRRLYCENPHCPKQTFVEQVDGLTRRYQRRTPALQRVVEAVALTLAGTAGARLLLAVHQVISCTALLGCLMGLPVPHLPTPAVIGVDDFALRRVILSLSFDHGRDLRGLVVGGVFDETVADLRPMVGVVRSLLNGVARAAFGDGGTGDAKLPERVGQLSAQTLVVCGEFAVAGEDDFQTSGQGRVAATLVGG